MGCKAIKRPFVNNSPKSSNYGCRACTGNSLNAVDHCATVKKKKKEEKNEKEILRQEIMKQTIHTYMKISVQMCMPQHGTWCNNPVYSNCGPR